MLARQLAARLPQDAGADWVGLFDVAATPENEATKRSELVEFVTLRFKLRPGLAKLRVLKLQLGILSLQFMNLPTCVLVGL